MFQRIFSLSNAALLVALTLSIIAAWYSIIGLTAIFAGAVIPIIIMGSALELAKITTTVWLRKYWHRCGLLFKFYLVPAVVVLALLTSMGIFGFLSKAHMDQGIISGDSQAKLSILDEKIKTQRDNIELARKALAQMDAQVDQMLGRTDSDKGAERAVAIRRQQAKERTSLQNDVASAQKEISKLNEERAPIAAENRKVEAEVGPIKYIAALIYGDNPDATVLERAVRWVIILLVIVFDPLAIMLVLAANQSKDWDKEVDEVDDTLPVPKYEPDDGPLTESQIEQINKTLEEPLIDKDVVEELDDPIKCYKCDTELVDAPGIGLFCPNKECDVIDNTSGEEPIEFIVTNSNPADNVPVVDDDTPPFEGFKDPNTGEWIQTGPAFAEKEKDTDIQTEGVTMEAYRKLDGGYVEYEGKRMHERVLKDTRPDLFGLTEDEIAQIGTGFGTQFPQHAAFGDIFVRVDTVPNRVYKFNSRKWIEIPRESSDSYLDHEKYVQFLVNKLSTGEYDPEILTTSEQDAIQQYLEKTQG